MSKIAEGVGFVHVTDPETSEVTVYGPGDEVAKEHKALVAEHCFVAGAPLDSEIEFVAGPSQGLNGLSAEDQALLEKARKAEASRRSRGAAKAKSEPTEAELQAEAEIKAAKEAEEAAATAAAEAAEAAEAAKAGA